MGTDSDAVCGPAHGAMASYLRPIFERVVELVPADSLASTQVFVQGTAGMRLIDEGVQAHMWQCMVFELNALHHEFPFASSITADHVGTIEGHDEAYYAVLASNFIAGRIDASLRPVEGTVMLGALDMGGSSTQLIFHTGTDPSRPVQSTDFWSHSYLSMGVNTMREHVWGLLFEEQHGEVVLISNPNPNPNPNPFPNLIPTTRP